MIQRKQKTYSRTGLTDAVRQFSLQVNRKKENNKKKTKVKEMMRGRKRNGQKKEMNENSNNKTNEEVEKQRGREVDIVNFSCTR